MVVIKTITNVPKEIEELLRQKLREFKIEIKELKEVVIEKLGDTEFLTLKGQLVMRGHWNMKQYSIRGELIKDVLEKLKALSS